MSVNEILKNEKEDLKSFKKVYESVSFLILMVLIFQQITFLIINLINFSKSGWFSTNNFATANLQAFVSRIVGINSSSTVFIILGILAWVFYYFLVYLLVWNFCNKQGHAKWTWTLFVTFGPTIFLAPAYIWYILYIFHKPILLTIKNVLNTQEDDKTSNRKKEVADSSKIVE